MTLLLFFAPLDAGNTIDPAGLTGHESSDPLLSATIGNSPMSNVLTVGSTNVMILKALRNHETGAYLDNATVVLTALLDPNGATVTGTANIAMPYISGVGRAVKYRGTIPHTVPLVAGTTYTRRFTATDTAGNVRRFDKPIVAVAG